MRIDLVDERFVCHGFVPTPPGSVNSVIRISLEWLEQHFRWIVRRLLNAHTDKQLIVVPPVICFLCNARQRSLESENGTHCLEHNPGDVQCCRLACKRDFSPRARQHADATEWKHS